MLSTTQQPADVTFYKRKPTLAVKVSRSLGAAMMYGAGARKLQELLNRIEFSDGTTASFGEIWTINAMPTGGFSQEDLDAVDLAEAEERVGPGGETLREMIRQTYRGGDVFRVQVSVALNKETPSNRPRNFLK